ncbi:hypothetical protein [Sphingobacterium puteale]|uniref:hypothetical protein n=1 Tax=Sphingobacterium puteale TaxID=2420510 RepID=UPI003D96D2A6
MKKALLLLGVMSFLFFSCDKEGGPIPSDKKLEIQKDGVNYVDERSIILPPGAYDGPRLIYNTPSTTNPSGIKESIRFTSSPYKKGNRNNTAFTFSIYFPVEGGVSLNKKYEIKPINGKEIFNIEKDGKIWEHEKDLAYIRYTEDYKTYHYGTGYISFTHFDDSGLKENIKGSGTIEFSIANENGSRTTLKGTFKL